MFIVSCVYTPIILFYSSRDALALACAELVEQAHED